MKKTFNPEITAIINDDLAEGIYMQNSGWVLDSPFYATQGLGNANNHNAAIGCTYGHPRSEGVTDGNTHGDDMLAVYQGNMIYYGINRSNVILRLDILIESPLDDIVTNIDTGGNFGQMQLYSTPAVVGNRIITYWQGPLQNGDSYGFDAFYVHLTDIHSQANATIL